MAFPWFNNNYVLTSWGALLIFIQKEPAIADVMALK